MPQIDQLPAHTVRCLAHALRAIFGQLAADLPTHASKRLATSFESFSKWLLKYYDAAIQAAELDPEPEQTIRRIDSIFSDVLRDVQTDCSRLIHPPGAEDFPQNLALWAKEWLCSYGGYDRQTTSVALIPHWPFYPEIHLVPNPLKTIETKLVNFLNLDVKEGFDEDLKAHPERFLLFTFPRAEGRNVLFHPMLLHEFGHAIDLKRELCQKVWDKLKLPDETSKDEKRNLVSWIREFLADLLATRLGGPCFALALHRLSVVAKVLDDNSKTHPATRTRLAVILEHLTLKGMDYFEESDHSAVVQTLGGWREDLGSVLPKGAGSNFELQRNILLAEDFRPYLHGVVTQYCETEAHPSFDSSKYTSAVPGLVKQLRRGLPPMPEAGNVLPLPAVFNATWELVLAGDCFFKDFNVIKPSQQASAIRAVSDLAFKGIEAAEVREYWRRASKTQKATLQKTIEHPNTAGVLSAAVLTEQELREQLENRKDFKVTPILDPEQIGEGSINLRLGTHFIVTKASNLASFDPKKLLGQEIRRFQQHVSRSFGERLVLHPRRLVLSATFEYIALPDEYAALVLSRSSYGRVGLVVATAAYVHPGWKGCLTLELSNIAEIPLELRCGAPIAQLVVFRADRLPPKKGKEFPVDRRRYPTFPEFSALGASPDWQVLEQFEDRVKDL